MKHVFDQVTGFSCNVKEVNESAQLSAFFTVNEKRVGSITDFRSGDTAEFNMWCFKGLEFRIVSVKFLLRSALRIEVAMPFNDVLNHQSL